MTMASISEGRTVPVTEDLTTEDLSLQILRGLETAFRVDKPFVAGKSFLKGDWAVLNADGKLTYPATAGVANTYLIFAGNDRYDARATGQCTMLMGHVVAKTEKYNKAATYEVGSPLTYKNIGGDVYKLTIGAPGNDAILGHVIEEDGDTITFETVKSVS